MTDLTTADLAALFEARFGIPVPDMNPGEAAQDLAGILGRSVCRKYRPDRLGDTDLALLLAATQSAPSKSDLQQFSVILVDDPASRVAALGNAPTSEWSRGAPHFLVFCGDMRRGQKLAARHGLAHANNNVDTFMNAAVDAGIALGMTVVAAEAMGLGTCPISVIRDRIAAVTEALGLPDGVFPVAGLCVGWPERFEPISMRLPPPVVVHRERYDDGALEREIDAYDARRRVRQRIADGSQRHVDRYGVDPEITWSRNAARQLSVPERAGFAAFLKAHGIDLA